MHLGKVGLEDPHLTFGLEYTQSLDLEGKIAALVGHGGHHMRFLTHMGSMFSLERIWCWKFELGPHGHFWKHLDKRRREHSFAHSFIICKIVYDKSTFELK